MTHKIDELNYSCVGLIQIKEKRSQFKTSECLLEVKGLANTWELKGNTQVSSISDQVPAVEHKNYLPKLKSYDFMIAITMYDESYELFHKTMAALNENIDFLEQNGINTEKYAVVVIVDGIG